MNNKRMALSDVRGAEPNAGVTIDRCNEACQRINEHIRKTPLSLLEWGPTKTAIYLKRDDLQITGSFKIRGALNFLLSLSPEDREKGVVGRSSGNFGQALAWAGKLLNCPVTVLMPGNSSQLKIELVQSHGARVIRYQGTTSNGDDYVDQIIKETGGIKAYTSDHPNVIMGQGTIAFEILEQHPDVDTVFCPVSGGGLLSGVAFVLKHLKPTVKVIGVEPIGANRFSKSLAAGERLAISMPDTIADGLRTCIPGTHTFPLVQRYVDDVITVTDDQIRAAMRYLATGIDKHIEPSGAVSVAGRIAYDSGKVSPNSVCVISGGNISDADFESLTTILGGSF